MDPVIRYLELRGYHVIDNDYHGYVVIEDDYENAIAFVKSFIVKDRLDKVKIKSATRHDFEKTICNFLKDNAEYVDMDVRYDEVILSVISNDRGIVKHYVNACDRLED